MIDLASLPEENQVADPGLLRRNLFPQLHLGRGRARQGDCVIFKNGKDQAGTIEPSFIHTTIPVPGANKSIGLRRDGMPD